MKQGPKKEGISIQNNAQETKPYEIWIKKINDYETAFLKKCSGLIEHFLNNQENAGEFVNPADIKAIEAAVKGVIDNFPKEVIEREWCFRENAKSIVKTLERMQQSLNVIPEFLDKKSSYFMHSSVNTDIDDFVRYRRSITKQSKFLGERIKVINDRIEDFNKVIDNRGPRDAKSHSELIVSPEFFDASWCSSDSDYSNNARFFSKGILIGILVASCFLILLPAAIWCYNAKNRNKNNKKAQDL